MMFRRKKQPKTTGTGIGLPGGTEHYRAYVGPPHYYDLMAAMAFNLMTTCGLREHHRVLDIGCGSLRMGRLLIPYLLKGNYTGIEPNEWLVQDGLLNELGEDILSIKKPRFIYDTQIETHENVGPIDYAMAQSIFTHCAPDQITSWLEQIRDVLSPEGVLLATYFSGEEDYQGTGWIYPDCAFYKPETMEKIVKDAGFGWQPLDWHHPRKQKWVAIYRQKFDEAKIGQPLTWNHYIECLPPG
jgi:cyclopropane fatty-acyl-phospholipid synthase-like methyltransferase